MSSNREPVLGPDVILGRGSGETNSPSFKALLKAILEGEDTPQRKTLVWHLQAKRQRPQIESAFGKHNNYDRVTSFLDLARKDKSLTALIE